MMQQVVSSFGASRFDITVEAHDGDRYVLNISRPPVEYPKYLVVQPMVDGQWYWLYWEFASLDEAVSALNSEPDMSEVIDPNHQVPWFMAKPLEAICDRIVVYEDKWRETVEDLIQRAQKRGESTVTLNLDRIFDLRTQPAQ